MDVGEGEVRAVKVYDITADNNDYHNKEWGLSAERIAETLRDLADLIEKGAVAPGEVFTVTARHATDEEVLNG